MELTRTQQKHRRICVTQPRREKPAGKLLGETAGIYKISQQTRKRVREKWKVECHAMHNHRHPQRCNTSSQQSYSRVLCGSLGREGGRSLRIHDNPPADLAREREPFPSTAQRVTSTRRRFLLLSIHFFSECDIVHYFFGRCNEIPSKITAKAYNILPGTNKHQNACESSI